jgi:protein transport protein SEC13
MFDAPTSLSNEIPSGHNGNIKILAQQPTTNTFASGGEDGYINIYTLTASGNQSQITPITQLTYHTNTITSLAFSHPKNGEFFASASLNNDLIIYQKVSQSFEVLYTYNNESSYFTTMSFAPSEYGLILICGSENGTLSVHEYNSTLKQWNSYEIQNAHGDKCITAISFGSALPEMDFQSGKVYDGVGSEMRFVSSGKDGVVRFWVKKDGVVQGLERNIDVKESVVDVDWMNVVAYANNTIVVLDEKGEVRLYKEDKDANGLWECFAEFNCGESNAKVSFSEDGQCVVICGDKGIKVFKENEDLEWEEVGLMR